MRRQLRRERFLTAALFFFMTVLTMSLNGCGGGGGTVLPPGSKPAYSVGGIVSGLTGTGLVLQNNGSDDLLITSGSTTFTFTTKVSDGGGYNVTVSIQPSGLLCKVNNGIGTVSGGDITTVSISCTPPPKVISTDPSGDPQDLSTFGLRGNNPVAVSFSKVMDAATLTNSTFIISRGGTPVTGTVTYLDVSAQFKPASPFTASTIYTATVTTGAKDPAGNPLVSDYTWTFFSGGASAPTVSLTAPGNLASSVPVNALIKAEFSETMDPATISQSTFTVNNGGTPVTGTVNCADRIATFMPLTALAGSTVYTADIMKGVKTLAGKALVSNYTWTFTTGVSQDTTPPGVISTNPLSGASGVAVTYPVISPVGATFSEPMDRTTLNDSMYIVDQSGTLVRGVVSSTATTIALTPSSALAYNTTYTATVTASARDIAGNALVTNYTWTFTTLSSVACTPGTTTANSCVQSGPCAGSVMTCLPDGTWPPPGQCNYTQSFYDYNRIEFCDGFDNNCNTMTDEFFTKKGKTCYGTSGGSCTTGAYICSMDSLAVQCSASGAACLGQCLNGVCLPVVCQTHSDCQSVAAGSYCAANYQECFPKEPAGYPCPNDNNYCASGSCNVTVCL